ncbi:hypothetical protein ONZ45_g8875 [Pleurotus djamor]|nr:hypothetical protein ONZ45_g8875 [Pleurotus djamor]
MPPTRFTPSAVKNKIKREQLTQKARKAKTQEKLKRRLALAKDEATNPAAKKKRLSENVPRTLDNTREFDPSILTADPSKDQPHASTSTQEEVSADIDADPFASYFTSTDDPTIPPKVLITTSPKASKRTYDFCDELGKGFELGRIAGWAADRGYKHLYVVNEDMKKPNAITLVHLPNGPTAYFKLSSIQLTKEIFGHARATPHNPELILNGFVTRLGLAVGRMFQTLFPPIPEFQDIADAYDVAGRYAFRSTEKVALQEIGPRFTLKLRSLRKDIPAVTRFGESNPGLEIEVGTTDVPEAKDTTGGEEEEVEENGAEGKGDAPQSTPQPKVPPKQDEYLWQWKPELETTRRTFFL